jgi:flavorubredoxin
MFPRTLEAVASVIDPASVRWIGISHFEADECGALNEWLEVAPHAQAVGSLVGIVVNLNDYANRPARALSDGEVLEIGRSRLQFLATPHVPHCWDAGLFFEQVHQTLLCSDLFFHPGEVEPLIESGVVDRASESIINSLSSPLGNDMPYTANTSRTLQRLADLMPQTLALMHGSSFRGDGHKAIMELSTVINDTLGKFQKG